MFIHMCVNNNLYFVVGNLCYWNIPFQAVVLIYVWPVEKSVSLANSPYFPLSSIIPFVRLTTVQIQTIIINKTGPARLMNDFLLLILMWHVSFFVVVTTLMNHKITFLIKINSKDDTDSRFYIQGSAQGPAQRIRL